MSRRCLRQLLSFFHDKVWGASQWCDNSLNRKIRKILPNSNLHLKALWFREQHGFKFLLSTESYLTYVKVWWRKKGWSELESSAQTSSPSHYTSLYRWCSYLLWKKNFFEYIYHQKCWKTLLSPVCIWTSWKVKEWMTHSVNAWITQKLSYSL